MGVLFFQIWVWGFLALVQYFWPDYIMGAAMVAAVSAFFDIRKKELLYFQLGSIVVALMAVQAYIPS